MIIYQPDRHLLKNFVSKHAKTFHGSVLDVGGGPIRYKHLFDHCDAYTTLDISPETKPDIVASADNMPIEDNSYDGIICSQVLGDVWNVKKAVAEMIRILKPGGVLLITESLFNEQHDEPHDYWRFTEFAWQKLLEDTCAIEIIEHRGGYFQQKAQQCIRYHIEKYNLYFRPILGRVAHILASALGKYAEIRDKMDSSESNKKFPIGHCILARKK